jgi:hypothetical protein
VAPMNDWWTQSAPVVDVKVNDRWRLRLIGRALRLVWALGRVWWPVLAPLVVLRLALGVPVVLAVAMVATSTALVVILCDRARGWLWSRPTATGAAVFRWRWPTTCSLAGVTVAVHGAIRVPRLIGVELKGRPWAPASLRLQIEPAGPQDFEGWDILADRLARQLRFAVGTMIALDKLTLELRLRRDRLPTLVVLGRDVPLSAVAPGPNVVAFGESSLGGVVRWELDDPTRTSVLIGGSMGGGKGDVLTKVLLWVRSQLLAGHPVQVLVFNPKGVGEFNWARSFAQVLRDRYDMVMALHWLRAEIERRAAILDQLDLATWLDLPAETRTGFGPRIVLIIDEFVSFVGTPVTVEVPDESGKGRTPKFLDLMRTMAAGDLHDVTSQARALGVNVVIATQHTIGETMGGSGYGTTLVANMGGRIGLGSMEPSGASTLFGRTHGDGVSLLSRSKLPGRMFYQALNRDDDFDGEAVAEGDRHSGAVAWSVRADRAGRSGSGDREVSTGVPPLPRDAPGGEAGEGGAGRGGETGPAPGHNGDGR